MLFAGWCSFCSVSFDSVAPIVVALAATEEAGLGLAVGDLHLGGEEEDTWSETSLSLQTILISHPTGAFCSI